MPYHVSSPTTIEQAFLNTADFLNNETGWDAVVYGDDDQMRVQLPDPDRSFNFSYVTRSTSHSSYGVLSREDIVCEVAGSPAEGTLFTASCDYITPITRLFVHAGNDPEPWVLMTFETAPGYFHHLFFGYVEKLGQYDGGAIASGFTSVTVQRGSTSFNSWRGSTTGSTEYGPGHFLFGSMNAIAAARRDRAGGMEIRAAEAPETIYRFGELRSSGFFIGGGPAHGHNALLAAVETSHIDGSVNAHPIVLHAQITGDHWQTPVAVIPGVRMINITDLTPAAVITLGGEFWQVFPLCNKSLPYGGAYVPAPGEGPGRLTLGSSTTNFYNMGGATEHLGIAVRREP